MNLTKVPIFRRCPILKVSSAALLVCGGLCASAFVNSVAKLLGFEHTNSDKLNKTTKLFIYSKYTMHISMLLSNCTNSNASGVTEDVRSALKASNALLLTLDLSPSNKLP